MRSDTNRAIPGTVRDGAIPLAAPSDFRARVPGRGLLSDFQASSTSTESPMRLQFPEPRLSLLLSAICLTSPLATAQTTWIFGECDGQLGSTPIPGVANYATDSRIPNDPVTAGQRAGTVYPTTAPVLGRVSGEGGVAIDKINKLLYVTNGDRTGNLTLEIHPLPGDSCAPGPASGSMTVTGTYPFAKNVTGITIEYWTSPLTGLDEPYRMWCSAGENQPDGTASSGQYHWFWLTPNPPPGQTPGAWSTTIAARTTPNGGFNMRDIAFGWVRIPSSGGSGSFSGPKHGCLFGIVSGGFPQSMVDVWDVNSGQYLYTNNASGLVQATGVAIDTSMPIDLVNSNPPHPFGPPRKISGRVLLSGIPTSSSVPIVKDITGHPNLIANSTWNPVGIGNCTSNPYFGGMAYSAEVVTAGSPNGIGCAQGMTSSARTGILLRYPPNANPAPTNPAHNQDPIRPGQTLVGLKKNGQPAFEFVGCNPPPGENAVTNTTPFLLVEINSTTPWTDPVTGQTLITTPPGPGILNPTATILSGAWLTPNLVAEASFFQNPALGVPASPLPPAIYDTPQVPRHYKGYAQWIFICGTYSSFPTNFPNVPYYTSEPVRFGLSNTN